MKPSEKSSHCKSKLMTTDSSEAVEPCVLRMLTPVEGAYEVQGETVEGGSCGDREICASPATVDGGKQKRKLEWAAERKQKRQDSKLGAVFAPSRTNEGYTLPSGNQESCFPDGTWNGMHVLDSAAVTCGVDKFRNKSIPKLGNELQASFKTIKAALVECHLPFELTDVSHQFQSLGPPFLNLLQAPPAVYIVGMCVTIKGKIYPHCVMLSTIPEEGKPYGKMIDNGSSIAPVYIEARDRENKKLANAAFRKLLTQKIKDGQFSATPTFIYHLQRKGDWYIGVGPSVATSATPRNRHRAAILPVV